MAVRKLKKAVTQSEAQASVKSVFATLKAERRPYQERIVTKCMNEFAQETHSVLIEAPTGSGKTIMSLTTAQALFDSLKGSDSEVAIFAVFVTMRRENLDQAKRAYKKFGFNFPIVYATQFEKAFPSATLMIVDEAHHDATTSMQQAYSVIAPAFVLGMTATPYRSDKVGLGFQKIIKDAGYYSLIRDGYLSKPSLYMLTKFTPKTVAKAYVKDVEKWGKTIIFFHAKEQCNEARDLIVAAGVSCSTLYSDTPDREEIISKFRSGEISCLLNMTLLTEGFDLDSLETVFVRPSVKGLTMQMCGRVLRLSNDKSLIKKIVQCTKTRNPFSSYAPVGSRFVEKLTDEENEDAETEWLGVGESSLIETVHRQVLELRLNSPLDSEACELVGKIKEGQRYKTEFFSPKIKSGKSARRPSRRPRRIRSAA